MKALIDADLVAFRCAATVPEHESVDVATYRIDCLMRQILEATDAPEFIAFLSGRNNFRKKINTEYKANRKDKEPPVYLQECREYLIKEWNAIVSHNCEADDLLGIHQNSETILCSLDKDLLMIPGTHFNWTKVEITEVTQLEGLKHFYKQMLIGDRSDNIFGVTGIGPVKAARAIDVLDNEQDMFELVYSMYDQDDARFLMNANCLWIQQNVGEVWANRQNLILPDPFKQELNKTLDFMKSLNLAISTELGMIQQQTSGTQDNGTGLGKTKEASSCLT